MTRQKKLLDTNEESSRSEITSLLSALLSGHEISNSDYIRLNNAIKPVFFTPKGYVNWRWQSVREQTKRDVAYRAQLLLQKKYSSLDDLVVEYTSHASELFQSRQVLMSYENDLEFGSWPADKIPPDSQALVDRIREALEKGGRERERAIVLITQYSEKSSSQSRKSVAGNVAQDAVELVLQHVGLEKGEGYGAQFKYKGSDTDFTVPFADRNDASSVRAFIAVQSSTNDRARLSSSELHRGALRFLVSLNGCPASPKDTSAIGDDLVGKYIEDENFYVVIEDERQRAIADSLQRLERAVESDSLGLDNSKKRVRWLEEYSMNFDTFARRVASLV